MSDEFYGIGPDGEPTTFRFADGPMYINVCPDCGKTNGGGIGNPFNDKYAPTRTPCLFCGRGPMIVEYLDNE